MVATKNPFFDQLLAALQEMETLEIRNAWLLHGKQLQKYQEALRRDRIGRRPSPVFLDLEAVEDFMERIIGALIFSNGS